MSWLHACPCRGIGANPFAGISVLATERSKGLCPGSVHVRAEPSAQVDSPFASISVLSPQSSKGLCPSSYWLGRFVRGQIVSRCGVS